MDGISDPLATASTLTHRLRPQRLIIALALFLLMAGAIALSSYGWHHSLLFLIGGLLGVTLYHSSFGFASAYRKLLVQRDVTGLYAQVLMLAIATLLFAPVLASGSIWGQPVRGAIAPVGVPGAIGAFLFGIGMQVGGACGCGTLYTIGGGSVAMVLTLITFCVGAFGASLTRQLWAGLPATPAIALGNIMGWWGAVILQLMVLGLVVILLRGWSRTGRGTNSQPAANPTLWRGPWSIFAGAIALAVLNWLTLLLSGQPWRITWGFALWVAVLARQFGWDAASSPFWSSEASQKALSQGIFADVSSVMNLGIILGALLAAALAGRLILRGQFTPKRIASTLLGGLVMGYGAFLAYGCNVSAFFGGIASTSVHGWVWIGFALLGTAIGIRLRPLLDLK